MFGTTLIRYFYNSRDVMICTTVESLMAPIQSFQHHKKVSHSRLTSIAYLYLILSKTCRVSRLTRTYTMCNNLVHVKILRPCHKGLWCMLTWH